jgi:hypothetical protein
MVMALFVSRWRLLPTELPLRVFPAIVLKDIVPAEQASTPNDLCAFASSVRIGFKQKVISIADEGYSTFD